MAGQAIVSGGPGPDQHEDNQTPGAGTSWTKDLGSGNYHPDDVMDGSGFRPELPYASKR